MRRQCVVLLIMLPGLLWCSRLNGQTQAAGITTPSQESGWVSNWLDRVTRIQAAQPHWITPLATTTPRLEQEYRFDYDLQQSSGIAQNLGGGKGLELIPLPDTEVIVTQPAYMIPAPPSADRGWGNSGFLVKYRIASGNETHGNYIVTLFFSTSFPTGTNGLSARHEVFTPTIAVGKGWGNFDVQSTFGVGIPSRDRDVVGAPVSWNTAFQYRVLKKLWPEFEINSTFWPDGLNAGKKQIFLTPGIVVGRIPLHNRLGLTIGAGVQIAATEFHAYRHALILSFRMPF